MEVLRSSEKSVYIRATRRYIPENGSIHNCRCENPKSYIVINSVNRTANIERIKNAGFTELHPVIDNLLLSVPPT
jgi:hypothetical protein